MVLFNIPICTYQRYDILKNKTLNFLNSNGIDSGLIDLFVANKEEYKKYKEKIPSYLYHDIIIGEIGYHNIKNYINDYYPKNTRLWELDDDVSCIKVMGNRQATQYKHLKEYNNIHSLVEYCFHLLNKYDARLLGFNPHGNCFYMSPTLLIGLYFNIGNSIFYINKKDIKLELPDKTDYELSIKSYLKDGKVLRLNNIYVKTSYDIKEGGTGTYRTNKLRGKYNNYSMYDYILSVWNSPKSAKSPFKYFEGILYPVGVDESNNVIYKYNNDKAR